MEKTHDSFVLTDHALFKKPALILGIIGLVAAISGYFVDQKQFFFSYLTAYVFWMSLIWGAMFFSFLHHLTGADWSIVLRRILETVLMVLPVMAILIIPVLLGIHDLYHWSHTDVVAGDPVLLKKSVYLNPLFFSLRTALYFLIWFLLARTLYKTSLAQDQAFNPMQIARMKRVSAPGMILFALTITFASFDWLMSLEAHWYSTIFGVYIFGGSLLAILAFLVLFGLYLRRKNILVNTITVEHYHDIGKFLFAFIIFWGYIGFSQYFLIWYANIPEETVWYLARWHGSWKIITMTIVFGHFVIPFVLLMPRAIKRNFRWLKIIAIWIAIMHWVDIYWVAMPSLHVEGFLFSWMDAAAFIGIGGIFLWYFLHRFAINPLVPLNDPRLDISIHMKN